MSKIKTIRNVVTTDIYNGNEHSYITSLNLSYFATFTITQSYIPIPYLITTF
jgi:hypothetical protein